MKTWLVTGYGKYGGHSETVEAVTAEEALKKGKPLVRKKAKAFYAGSDAEKDGHPKTWVVRDWE